MESGLIAQDSLVFVYKAFLQSVEIQIQTETLKNGSYHTKCRATLKLPILKKNYSTWTLFSNENLDWQKHSPVCEEGSSEKTVEKEQFLGAAEDPIGFFLKINRGTWTEDRVNLVIGNKQVPLSLEKAKNQIIIQRAEKNQKLIIKMGDRGIEALEVPIPVLGSLKIRRVF